MRHAVLRAVGFVAALSIAALASDADAIGLGSASLQSGLGERLRLSFPVSTQPDEDVGCVQVRGRGDDLPSVFNTRTNVIRNGFQTRVEVTSAQPVNEPAVALVVSVGCASPVSREYVLFLDPPAIAPELPMETGGPVATGDVPRRASRPVLPRRPPSTIARSTADGAAAPSRVSPGPSARRPPRPRAPAVPGDVPLAGGTRTPPAIARNAAPSSRGRDRLTIAPNEPADGTPLAPIAPTGSLVTPPAVPPVAALPSTPNATPAPPSPAAPSVPAAAPPLSSSATAPSAAAPSAVGAPSSTSAPVAPVGGALVAAAPVSPGAAEVAARDQAVRDQQAELQRQVKALSDQIAALRVQTTTLATRNQTLEESAATPTWMWLLAALAAVATLVAAWLAWRYAQLRRSVDGAAWWTGNTVHAPADADTAGVDTRSGLTSLDAGTRMAGPRPATLTDTRGAPPAPQAAVVSNVEKARVAPRNVAYPAAIDTDFTVSDIEAAMATVRTVSPPREAPRQSPLAESDFAGLGGPTLPSPFAEPPPPPPPPPARAPKVVERDGDNVGKFVDLDIPPLPPGSPRPASTPPFGQAAARAASQPPAAPQGAPARPAAPAPRSASPDDVSEPLDFKLDIPPAFDPLATDSHKTTVVDPVDAREAVDFELPGSPMPLDFELPPADGFGNRTDAGLDDGDSPMRHGATALNDLFPSHGPDTILDLDERHGAPLSTTEVDRLTTTAVEGNGDASAAVSPRLRMARFADLMDQVDEAAETDPLRAIAHLRQYVLRDEQIPTLLWLRLFELYRKVDKKPVYEALGEHFSRRYHRPMVGWSQTLADRVPQTPLSAMGPIDREIEASWGREEGLERLRSLLCDRDQPDAVVFNAVLQRDLLDAAKVFPADTDPVADPG